MGFCSAVLLLCWVFAPPDFCFTGLLLCRVFGILRHFLIGGKEKRGQIFNDLKFVVFCFGFCFGCFASSILPKTFCTHMETRKSRGIALDISLCGSPIPPTTANYYCIRIPSRISAGERLSSSVPSPI